MTTTFRLSLTALCCLVFSTAAIAQAGNASVGGFVQDATQAVIPGVTVTAENTQTGVVSKAITNETGTYTILSLLPGTYRLSAELPGFRPHIYNNVQLGTGVLARYNFTLQVGEVTQGIEVTADSLAMIAESSATIGQVLPENQVRDLPLVGNDVLDLMRVMGGIRGNPGSPAATFAGISASMVNTTRDGLNVQDSRYENGVFSTTVINPEMVGEMRVILTPVDAEMGRGNGQIQITTRSGTNRYTGSAVWSVTNTALDANTWDNNNDIVNGVWTPTQPDWFNRNEYTVSVSGPLVRNKTFFFTLWEQRDENQRTTQRPVILSDCARNGIFRYFDGWVNGNANTTLSGVGGNPTRAVVDSFGNPLTPATNPGANQNPDTNPFTGQLRYFSVFGRLANTPTQPDCSDAVLSGGSWDPLRIAPDSTGLIRKYLDAMPRANRFDGGDGLNTAVHQWLRGSRSNGGAASALGTNTDTDRKQINVKVDHAFSTAHKAAVNYSYEWTDGDYTLSPWPSGYPGYTKRRPAVLTASFTSTLSPALLNEARFGYRKNQLVIHPAFERPDNEEARQAGLDLLMQGGQGFPIVFAPNTVGGMNPAAYICQSTAYGPGCAQQGNKGPLTTYADTLSWVRGRHSFKWGGEYRSQYTRGWASPTAPIPQAQGGAGNNPTQAFQNSTDFPAMASANQTLAAQLLYFLSGSVNVARQVYFLQNSEDLTKWENSQTVERKIIDVRQNEFAFFFKDDWKMTPRLTLNLGLRYEYYGVPFENNGLGIAPVGGGIALLGITGRSFDRWLRPGDGGDTNLLTTPEFVGPHTANPDKGLHRNDWNNWGPAVGFAWDVPWFGEGKTNVRGGYQMTFSGGGRLVLIDNNVFSNPGFHNIPTTSGPTDGSLFDLRNLPSFIPVPPSRQPMEPILPIKENQNGAAFDYNLSTPYVQNFTLSVTRKLTSKVDLDVRYIGTRGLKLQGTYNLNVPNVFYNPVLMDALTRTRQGENVELFDQMFLGLNLSPGTAGFAPVNGTTQRGSAHLRQSTTFRTALANGDFAAVATALDYFNGTGGGAAGVVPPFSGLAGERGRVLRRANQGFNVTGGITVPGGPVVPAGLFPENWISANPQFNQANYYSDAGSSVYHSLQVQGTLRPTHGVSFQGTYLWSRALGVPAAGYTNPAEREKDYILAANHRTHEFRSNGTFELPFGPNKLFFPNASGWLARAIERWESSVIFNLATGSPASVTAANMLYANGVADLVQPLSIRTGTARWGDPSANNQLVGNYFGNENWIKVDDPQCLAVATQLRNFCTLEAVADSEGNILIQNPQPGARGNIGRQTVENPGTWDFDANIRKTFRLSESKSMQIRFDAINILNHPDPQNPTLSINSSNILGYIGEKNDDHRQFQAQIRLAF